MDEIVAAVITIGLLLLAYVCGSILFVALMS